MEHTTVSRGTVVFRRNEDAVRITPCGRNAIRFEAFPGGEPFDEDYTLMPQKADAAIEETERCVTVTVGAVEHPMLPAHFIQWIVLETSAGYQKKVLKPETKPCAQFVLAEGETAVAAYEFCNLHGLWKAEV